MKPIKEKKERALGMKLFLKAERCGSPKCAVIRKPYGPGAHGQDRKRAPSDYGKQLKEKQKVQLVYGLTSRQLVILFRGKSPEKIYSLLERRLDRVVYYLGFAASPRIGRQIVSHGHIVVNGKRVTIPSYCVKVGDIVSVHPGSMGKKFFEDVKERVKQKDLPAWLIRVDDELSGKCISEPSLKDAQLPFDLSLVGEFYSR